MKHSLRVGKIFGIPLYLHYSWFIIFILITMALIYSKEFSHISYPLWTRILEGVAISLLLFASVIAHELAHSLVARRKGVPVRSITLFIFGGMAHITREVPDARSELEIAIAGPICSLMLGFLFIIIWFLVWGSTSTTYANPIFWLGWINVCLAFFNMIPGFPMDGGRVLRAIIWKVTKNFRRATQIASWSGRGFAYLFITGGIVIMFFGFGDGLYGLSPLDGLWFAFIGWFLDNAATSSYRQVRMQEELRGITARDVLSTDYPSISPTLSLHDLVHSFILPTGGRYFLVMEWGRLKGLVAYSDIKAVPRNKWETTQVAEVMTPVERMRVVHPGDSALSVLEKMGEYNLDKLPVVVDDVVIGIIIRQRVLHFIQLRSELKV